MCKHIYTFVCMYMHICTFVCLSGVVIHTHIQMYIYAYTYICIHTRIDVYIYTHIIYSYLRMYISRYRYRCTGWRRLMGSLTLQIIFHKRATKYRSLLRKMTYKDQGSYESSQPCRCTVEPIYVHAYVYTHIALCCSVLQLCCSVHTCLYLYI